MSALFETLAFALVIGGQFLAAIAVISKRASLYPDALRPAFEGRSMAKSAKKHTARPATGAISGFEIFRKHWQLPTRVGWPRRIVDLKTGPTGGSRREGAHRLHITQTSR